MNSNTPVSKEAARRDFLINNFDAHVDHIRTGQSRRFEILRYSFAGFFAFFAFILSIEDKRFLCVYPFETIVLIPGFLAVLVFLYIWIVNWNITKHGRYIQYMFDKELDALGIGPNLYQDFLRDEHFAKNRIAKVVDTLSLHSSQGVLAILILGCLVLYGFIEAHGGVSQVIVCPA